MSLLKIAVEKLPPSQRLSLEIRQKNLLWNVLLGVQHALDRLQSIL